MIQIEIVSGIENALENLYNLNEMVFDFWISELYDENENEMWDKWNEENLNLMEKDVMYSFGELQ